MLLGRFLSFLLVFFCFICVQASDYGEQIDPQDPVDIPLMNLGSPLRSLQLGHDEEEEDFVVQQLEKARDELQEEIERSLIKDDTIARQTEVVKKLKAEIAVYQATLDGDLQSLRDYIKEYRVQLEQLRIDDIQDKKIPLIESKILKLTELLKSCENRSTVASGDDPALSACRAKLAAIKAELDKNLVSQDVMDAAVELISAPSKTLQQRLDDMRKAAA